MTKSLLPPKAGIHIGRAGSASHRAAQIRASFAAHHSQNPESIGSGRRFVPKASSSFRNQFAYSQKSPDRNDRPFMMPYAIKFAGSASQALAVASAGFSGPSKRSAPVAASQPSSQGVSPRDPFEKSPSLLRGFLEKIVREQRVDMRQELIDFCRKEIDNRRNELNSRKANVSKLPQALEAEKIAALAVIQREEEQLNRDELDYNAILSGENPFYVPPPAADSPVEALAGDSKGAGLKKKKPKKIALPPPEDLRAPFDASVSAGLSDYRALEIHGKAIGEWLDLFKFRNISAADMRLLALGDIYGPPREIDKLLHYWPERVKPGPVNALLRPVVALISLIYVDPERLLKSDLAKALRKRFEENIQLATRKYVSFYNGISRNYFVPPERHDERDLLLLAAVARDIEPSRKGANNGTRRVVEQIADQVRAQPLSLKPKPLTPEQRLIGRYVDPDDGRWAREFDVRWDGKLAQSVRDALGKSKTYDARSLYITMRQVLDDLKGDTDPAMWHLRQIRRVMEKIYRDGLSFEQCGLMELDTEFLSGFGDRPPKRLAEIIEALRIRDP